jgi:sporulation protein YlmC with PRC-barrel domain
MTRPHIFTTSRIIDRRVTNPESENLGKIEELVVDLESGRIVYAVLSFGGLWGLGEKLFAIPWEAFRLIPGEAAIETFVLEGITREKLENAPWFDRDSWPNMSDPEWVNEIRNFYATAKTP